MTESGHGAAAGEGREVARDGAAAGDAPGVTHDGVTAAVSGGVAAPGALETARRSLGGDLGRGARAGLLTFWDLIKMMVPAYFVALLLERLGVISVLADAAAPVMDLLGLPGEAAVPLVVGYVLNIYAAIGAMEALSLSAQQVTVLAVAVLIGHNLLVEGVVLQRAGMNGVAFGLLRVVAGLAAAAVANLLMGAL